MLSVYFYENYPKNVFVFAYRKALHPVNISSGEMGLPGEWRKDKWKFTWTLALWLVRLSDNAAFFPVEAPSDLRLYLTMHLQIAGCTWQCTFRLQAVPDNAPSDCRLYLTMHLQIGGCTWRYIFGFGLYLTTHLRLQALPDDALQIGGCTMYMYLTMHLQMGVCTWRWTFGFEAVPDDTPSDWRLYLTMHLRILRPSWRCTFRLEAIIDDVPQIGGCLTMHIILEALPDDAPHMDAVPDDAPQIGGCTWRRTLRLKAKPDDLPHIGGCTWWRTSDCTA